MNELDKLFSIIVPARNEEAQISKTLKAIIKAIAKFENKRHIDMDSSDSRVELIVVDNDSIDSTAAEVKYFVKEHSILAFNCSYIKAACARNLGVAKAKGRVFIFVDADTQIPEDTLLRIHNLINNHSFGCGIFRLTGQKNSLRSWLWWTFWNHVRRLPLPKAKAFPALMFCARELFDKYGPFDEKVEIGEEWPILTRVFRAEPERLVYDYTLTAYSSNRRMELQPWGYTRTFLKYVWAIFLHKGRIRHSDHVRERK